MGLFDFLSGKGGGVKKHVVKANNKDAQSADRFVSLQALREDGSEEAVDGLLRRFTFNYDKTIDDEQEKEWVHDQLVLMANHEVSESDTDEEKQVKRQQKEIVLAAVLRALLRAETISWQLRVLADVATHEEAWPILDKVVAANDNQYTRDPSKKIQLIDFLGETFVDPHATEALLQYLDDVDETVRFKTVEALVHHKNEELSREPLLKLLISAAEESRRIKIRILDAFCELGWNTHGYKGQVEAEIQSIGRDYSIDGKGRIKKPQK